jgi:hypothetical protein
MYLNYYNNNNVRVGNSAPGTQISGPLFTIYSNRATPFIINNNYTGAMQGGFNCSIQHSVAQGSKIIQSGFYTLNSTTPTNTMGLCTDSGSSKPLWLNSYHSGTTDWPTGGKFSPQGSDVIMKGCFIGVRAGFGLTNLTDNPGITLGRSQYDYGIKIGGWNTGTSDPTSAVIQNSGNLHIDGSTSGDTYMNYYASQHSSDRDCRIYNLEDLSDRRIKNDFEEIDNTELLKQFNEIELLNYNFKDPKFRTLHNRIGFIADSLENQPYFYPFFKQSTSPMNMPFDMVNQVELDFIIHNEIVTIYNYEFDLTKKYYIYCYKSDGSFLTISDFPLTTNSFKKTFKQDIVKMVVIGLVRNDSKNVSLIKLVPIGFAISRAILEKNVELTKRVDLLELQMKTIYEKLNISNI